MAKQSTPKTMSSRLMTMKFMQRGAAAAAAASAASPSTPKTDDEGSASKRRKTQHSASTPGTPTAPLLDEYQAIRAALEEEERKRLIAVEKRAAELGDAHWVLDGAASSTATKKASASRAPLKVVQVGYAQIDYSGTRDDDDDDNEAFKTVDISTKARFQFNMKSKVNSPPHNFWPVAERLTRLPQTPAKEDSKDDSDNSDSDSGSDDSDSDSNSDSEEGEVSPDAKDKTTTPRGRHCADSPPSSKKRTRSSLSSRRNDERQKARELAATRRRKEVKLNQLTSISGAGASVQQQKPSFACHRCGKPGHKIAECPQSGGGSNKRQKR